MVRWWTLSPTSANYLRMWTPPQWRPHWVLRGPLQSGHGDTQPNMSSYRPSAPRSKSREGPAFSQTPHFLCFSFYSMYFLSSLSSSCVGHCSIKPPHIHLYWQQQGLLLPLIYVLSRLIYSLSLTHTLNNQFPISLMSSNTFLKLINPFKKLVLVNHNLLRIVLLVWINWH